MSVNINNAQLIKRYLVSADFPNTTTLYGWHLNGSGSADLTNFIGSLDLTLGAGGLTVQTDTLGYSTYCGFNGSTYLKSTNVLFNFTNSFSIGLWVYRSSWAAVGGPQGLISRYDGSNGWYVYLNTDGFMYFNTNSGATGTSSVLAGYTDLSAGWHHFAFARNGASSLAVYFDGCQVLKGYDATDAITAAGNLEIGSYNGGTGKFTGSIDEVIIHNGTTWSDSNVRKIYARGANILSYVDTAGIFQTIPAIQNIGHQIPIKVSDSNWTTYRAVGTIYYTINGSKRFKFHISGIYSGSPASGQMLINGILSNTTASYLQNVDRYASVTGWAKSYIGATSATITWDASGGIANLMLSGDIEIS